MSQPARRQWRALGSGVFLSCVDASALAQAVTIAEVQLAAIDRACSRFRDDSEVRALALDGAPHQVSALLLEAVAVALRAAELTGGLVDPTVTPLLEATGYDRDFAAIDTHQAATTPISTAVAGWRSVHLDRTASTLAVPRGLVLDLGATAKALTADRIAEQCAAAGVGSMLVSLGGDIAVSGPAPTGGWRVRIADDHAGGDGPDIAISSGGLATSSTTVRRWRRGESSHHHIIDPRTGQSAVTPWRTVSVAAATCVDANIASTAAIILGDAAVEWLTARGLPARLVDRDGAVTAAADWPSDHSPRHSA